MKHLPLVLGSTVAVCALITLLEVAANHWCRSMSPRHACGDTTTVGLLLRRALPLPPHALPSPPYRCRRTGGQALQDLSEEAQQAGLAVDVARRRESAPADFLARLRRGREAPGRRLIAGATAGPERLTSLPPPAGRRRRAVRSG